MNKSEKSVIKNRILNLARLRATGTPSDMAFRFDTSCRTVKRIVNEIRAEGHVIVFDTCKSSYVLKGFGGFDKIKGEALVGLIDNQEVFNFGKDEL